jgi:hypothetical protein
MDTNLINFWEPFSKTESDKVLVYRRRKKKSSKVANNSFELKSDGQFKQYNVSQDGKLRVKKGTYEIKDHFIYVNFDNPYEDFIINILYNDNKNLKIRK